MDGLRLALIIAGVVVVAAVYFWTARRRRLEREAGEFDRFDAWTDDSLDPLVDGDSMTQPNPRLHLDEDGEEPASAAGLEEPGVLQGLEAIAESLDTRSEPRLGAVDDLADTEAPPRTPPAPPAAPPPAPTRGRAPRAAKAKPPGRREPAAEPATAEPELVVVLNVMAPVGGTFDGPPLRDALENAGLRPGHMRLYHYRSEALPVDSPPIFSALNVVKPGTLAPEDFKGLRTPGVAMVLRLPGPERPIEAFELMHGVATQICEELGGRLCDETRSTLTRQALNHLRERIADLARRRRTGA